MNTASQSIEAGAGRQLFPVEAAETPLKGALIYAACGWSVLPIRAGAKTPLMPHGVLDSTRDAKVIEGLWSRWPNANVGIACGGASGGLVVLDIDPGGEATLAELQARHRRLPPSLEARTPRGGRHLVFKTDLPIRNSVGVLGDHLDIRASGGYILAAPSRIDNGGTYRWVNGLEPAALPEWLAELLIRRPQATVTALPGAQRIFEGARNATLTSLAGSMRRRSMSEGAILAALLAENAARCEPPLERGEVERIVRSITRYSPVAVTPGAPIVTPAAAEWPSPLAPEAFHGVVGEYVRAIEPHTEADPAALLVQFLAAFGNAAGRCAFFRVESDLHHANLFALLVGITSGGRKGTSLGRVREILTRIDPEWAAGHLLSGLSSGEGLIWAVRDPIERTTPVREKGRVVDYQTVRDDPGIADKRTLVLEPEFSSPLRVMGREGNTLSAIVRDAWDRGNLNSLTKNSPARATGAHISIVGHITKDELLRCLNVTEMANGFANRFLFACVRRSKCLPEGGAFNIDTQGDLIRRLQSALEFARTAGEVRRDPDARRMWADIYPQLSEERSGLLGAIISRAPAQVVRLSLIYALLDRSPVIIPAHLLAALAVWEFSESSARFIFADSLGDPIADRILAMLRANPEGLTRTQIRDLFGRHLPEVEVERALTALATAGAADRCRIETAGRPLETWRVARLATKATKATEDH